MPLTSAQRLAYLKSQRGKYGTTSKTVKIKEGKITVRLLAGKAGSRDDIAAEKFWRDTGIHWIKTDLNGKPVAVTGCHEIVHDKECPICAAVQRTIDTATDDDTLEIARQWQARKSVIVNALIRSGPDESDEPQILELTPTTWEKVLSALETYGEEFDVFDPKEGLDIIIERRGRTKNDTEYTIMPAPKSKPFDPKLLDNLKDLDAHIEREHFRGEDSKAIRAIGSMTGLALSAPTTGAIEAGGKSALLTSAKVDGAEEEDEKPKASKPKAKAAKPEDEASAEVEEDKKSEDAPEDDLGEVEDLLSELDELE